MKFWLISDLIFIGITGLSIAIEPRRMRNAVYCAITLFWLFLSAGGLSSTAMAPLSAAIFLLPGLIPILYFVLAFFLICNGITVIRKEGKSKTTLVTLFAGIAMLSLVIIIPALLMLPSSFESLTTALIVLICMMTLYISISLFCFFLYSILYSLLPKNPVCDYIIIHGAGLNKDGSPTPLLKQRIDKAILLYHKCHERPLLIPSGGQGADEIVSESESMKRYLLDKGIEESAILKEDRSTTPYENLYNVKELLDARENGHPYKCLFVTNNYHVLRTAFYSRKLGINAQGVGCHTARYYLPSAFIREYVAVMARLKWLDISYLLVILIMIFAIL